MSLREVSWGDEDLEETVCVSAPVVNNTFTAPSYNNTNNYNNNTNYNEPQKEDTADMPQWSVDTRGDLPTQKVLASQPTAAASAATPDWPEESHAAPSQRQQEYSSPSNSSPSMNSSNSNSNYTDLPPLTRRPGRDPMPGSRGGYSGGSSSAGPGAGGDRPPKPSGGNGRGRLDDISTLNIPGIDLNMLPRSTTGLSFSGNRGGSDRIDRGDRNNDRSERNDREPYRGGNDSRSPRSSYSERAPTSARSEYENRDEYGSRPGPAISYEAPVEAKEEGELSWGDEPEVVVAAPVYVPAAAIPAPVAVPLVHKEVERVEERTFRQPEPVRVVEQVSKAQSFTPVAIKNESARIESDGWGDEPEEVYVPVVYKAEPAAVVVERKAEPVVVEYKPEPVVERKVEPVVVERKVEPVFKYEPEVFASVRAASEVPAQAPAAVPVPMQMPAPMPMSPMAHSSSQGQMYPYPYPTMMQHHGGQQPGAHPSNNPMSPVGQMPPMSMMPGMMMPVWVTCPFCYHCYMYPPVVPAGVPTQAQN